MYDSAGPAISSLEALQLCTQKPLHENLYEGPVCQKAPGVCQLQAFHILLVSAALVFHLDCILEAQRNILNEKYEVGFLEVVSNVTIV